MTAPIVPGTVFPASLAAEPGFPGPGAVPGAVLDLLVQSAVAIGVLVPGRGLSGAASATAVAGAAMPIPSRRRAARRALSRAESRVGAPLALAVVLLLVALLVAPEQPRDQEAICQRHNGVAACRVW